MQGEFKTLLRKFCLESTILGLKYFYLYPDRISRCFWLANMLVVLSLAFFLSWQLYTRFAEIPTRVSIENQFEPLDNLPYPAVTLCSPNQITASFMDHFNKTLVDGNLTLDLKSVLPNLLGFYELVTDVNYNDLSQLQSLLDLNRYTVSDVMTAIPQSCDRFLKRCFMEGIRYENCSMLFTPILTTHGLCCSFNNVYHLTNKRNIRNPFFKVRNVEKPGLRHGLLVITDYEPEDALPGTILNAGATKVMYTDYTEFPAEDESSLVESNAESFHLIHATHTYCSDDVKAMPLWSRKCYFEDEIHLPFFGPYHNSDCDLTCYTLAVEKSCHCTLFFLPHANHDRVCNLTSILCIMDVKNRMSEWLNAADCDCPRDCESRRYRVHMSVGNLDALPHMIYDTYRGLTYNKSSSVIHIFFSNSVYVKQKQETVMSLITLASNLGGVFGLCLGCSIISVLEILFYMYIAAKNIINRRLRSSVVQPLQYHK